MYVIVSALFPSPGGCQQARSEPRLESEQLLAGGRGVLALVVRPVGGTRSRGVLGGSPVSEAISSYSVAPF